MKKAVSYATVIFWLSFSVLIFNSEPSASWEIGIITVCSIIIQLGSTPNPKIQKERHYKLEKIIPLDNGACYLVLSYDDKVETYRGEEIFANFDPQIGNEYLVEIENGTVFFKPI